MKKQIALTLLGLMTLSLTSCGTYMSVYADADKYLAGNQTYEQEITALDIDWISGSVMLVEDETITGVKVEEITNLEKEEELVHSYIDNGTLRIKFFASGHRCSKLFGYNKELTVTYKPGLEKIDIDLTSGSIKAQSVTAKKFNLDMTSGNAKIDTLVADDVDTDLTSGDIEIKKVTAKNMDADLTSGTFTVGYSAIEKASFDLTSGKFYMTLPEDGGTVKVSKTSGTVTTKRECKIDHNTYTFGTGSADIKVSMTSGKITID